MESQPGEEGGLVGVSELRVRHGEGERGQVFAWGQEPRTVRKAARGERAAAS